MTHAFRILRFPLGPDKNMLLVRLYYQMDGSLILRPDLPQRVSLIAATTFTLRQRFRDGFWKEDLPSERELCELLQVSRPTLRASLGELEREGWVESSPRRRRRICHPPSMENLAGEARLIVVVSPRPLLAMSPSAVVMVDELRTNLARANFRLELVVQPSCFSDRPEKALDLLVFRTPAAAWLIFGSREPMQRWFALRHLPCLVVGSCIPGMKIPSIDIDYRASCRHAGGLLRGKGHRSILLLLPRGNTVGESETEAGLREAMGEGEDAILQVIRHDGTAANLTNLLDKSLNSQDPPTCCVVARALHVLTVVTHLLRRGMRIPHDIAVISRDDEPFLDHLTPDVTRYAINPSRFTRRISLAARQLAEAGSLPPKSIRLIPQYRPGESV